MGRGVSTASGSVATVYIDVSEYQDDDFSDNWDYFVDVLSLIITERYPSFEEDDKWIGREDRSILINRHARVSVSQYGGLAAVCLVPRDDESGYAIERPELSAAWCQKVAGHWQRYVESRYPHTALNRLGTMSNGESVYKRIGAWARFS